jgi:hypothetical protein
MAKRSNIVPMPRDEYASVSIRKIDNGFIVSRSVSGPKGYSCSETFSPTKPKLDIPVAPAKAKAETRPSTGMAAVKKAAGKR